MNRYEYKTITAIRDEELSKLASELGVNGWELKFQTSCLNGDNNVETIMTFERQLATYHVYFGNDLEAVRDSAYRESANDGVSQIVFYRVDDLQDNALLQATLEAMGDRYFARDCAAVDGQYKVWLTDNGVYLNVVSFGTGE